MQTGGNSIKEVCHSNSYT